LESREIRVAATFVELADTLVDEFDIVDLLTLVTDRSVEVLNADAAGLLLASADGELGVMASSSDEVRNLELVAIQTRQGPCFECFELGRSVAVADLAAECAAWPDFVGAATKFGFRSANAIPLRVRGTNLGTLSLFGTSPGGMSPEDLGVAQAFADVASISVLQQRATSQQQLVREQLQHALNSRVAIEQAKGVIAERHGVDTKTAFESMRKHARHNGLRLGDVARGVVTGTIALSSELGPLS
jgi:GAF domain-containing protein